MAMHIDLSRTGRLIYALAVQIESRKDFERLRGTDPLSLTDLERAARFLYLQKLGFGGKVDAVFGVSVGHGPHKSP